MPQYEINYTYIVTGKARCYAEDEERATDQFYLGEVHTEEEESNQYDIDNIVNITPTPIKDKQNDPQIWLSE